MVEEAGLGVAFRAKPALAAVADARLDHHGLDALNLGGRPAAPALGKRSLARLDREAGLGRQLGAGGGGRGPALERPGLQSGDLADRHIMGLPAGECSSPGQLAEQAFGGAAGGKGAELDPPGAARRGQALADATGSPAGFGDALWFSLRQSRPLASP